MTEFTQLYLTPKIFLMGSSLAFSLKEDPVRCAKVCDKSWVILKYVATQFSCLENETILSEALAKVIHPKYYYKQLKEAQAFRQVKMGWFLADSSVCQAHSLYS